MTERIFQVNCPVRCMDERKPTSQNTPTLNDVFLLFKGAVLTKIFCPKYIVFSEKNGEHETSRDLCLIRDTGDGNSRCVYTSTIFKQVPYAV